MSLALSPYRLETGMDSRALVEKAGNGDGVIIASPGRCAGQPA
jgi:hypothetical protein